MSRIIKFRVWNKSEKCWASSGTELVDLLEGLDREYWKENEMFAM